MKIYLNRKPITGPWGGGNKVVSELVKKFTESGIDVVYKLEKNIDKIICFDPRPNDNGEWYQTFLEYQQFSGCKIIQRVGDLGTHSKPELTHLVQQSINFSDFVIFTSPWAKEWIGFKNNNCKIINNKPLPLFHNNKQLDPKLGNIINLVTHHWSTNPKKGFDVYKKLDEYLEDNKNYNFTYVGRLPKGTLYKNIKCLEPMNAKELSEFLPKQDIYVTASLEEAGANHVLEAMASGLPVVYHEDGGSIVDYCKSRGEAYKTFEQLVEKLEKISGNYSQYKKSVLRYNEDINQVISEYYKIILEV